MPVLSPVRRSVTYPASRMGAAIGMGLLPEPALSWEFARGEAMGPLAVTRAGDTATFVDAGGVQRTALADTARYDRHPRTGAVLGLLREPARTNLCLYSDDRSNVAWYASDVTIDGTDTIVEAATSGVGHGIVASVSLAGSTLYTYSEYLAPLGRRYVQLFADPGDANLNTWATFDLEAGVVTEDGSAVTSAIRPGPDGSWLCSMSFTTPGSPSNPYLGVFASEVATPGAYPIYEGNGEAAIRARGAQVEAGHCPTSRIATTSASVTRAADSIILSGAPFTGAWNPTEGTLLVEALLQDAPPASATTFLVALNDGTTSERINLYVNEANDGMGLFLADGGVQQTLLTIASTARYDGVPMRMTGAWRLNDVRSAAAAGQLSALDTSATMPTVTQMEVGAQASAGASGMATPVWFRRIAYWPRRLSDEQIRLLSAA